MTFSSILSVYECGTCKMAFEFPKELGTHRRLYHSAKKIIKLLVPTQPKQKPSKKTLLNSNVCGIN